MNLDTNRSTLMADLVLNLHTHRHTYAARHHQEVELRPVPPSGLADPIDSRGRPLVSTDLALLLDPQDHSVRWRRCALVVPLRRRSVALVCDTVSDLQHVETNTIMPLPQLLRSRLPHDWIAGIYMPADEPILLLDLYQIALSVLRQTTVPQGDRV